MFFKHHCMLCNKDHNTEFPYTEQEFSIRWDLWRQGRLVQNVFPELRPEQREAMQTGLCIPCWERLWKNLREEEDEDNG